MESMVKKFLSEAGYSDNEISKGIEYAKSKGADDTDEMGKLALSRILYSDSQLANGDVVGWEPVDWVDYE